MGVTFAGGQDHLKGKCLRIAHIGYFGPFDIVTAIAALEMALNYLAGEKQARKFQSWLARCYPKARNGGRRLQ